MTTPTFSVIGDLYSPTQLQRALVEASDIALAFMACSMNQVRPTSDLMDVFARLQVAALDAAAEHDACMKRTAPKVSNG
jgi:hypothetical protein